MTHPALQCRTIFRLTLSCILAVSVFFGINNAAAALVFEARFIQLGTSQPGATTLHRYGLSTTSPSTIGSLRFEYCMNDTFVGTACVPPVGLNVASAVIGSQVNISGLSVHPSTTANNLVLTRTPSVVPATVITLRMDNVINPTSPQQMVYLRMSSYPTTNASGPFVYEGGAAFAIQTGVGTEAYVPPFLIFCAAITVASNCSSSNGAYIGLGELSSSTPRSGTSQFAGATNDPGGYVVSVIGVTMTSGNNTISSSPTATNSIPGTPQFGINLRSNSNPSVGADRSGVGTLVATATYNSSNQYAFSTGATLASSPLPTEFNTMTVSYIVNVPQSQPPGVYSTTLTYVAVAAF